MKTTKKIVVAAIMLFGFLSILDSQTPCKVLKSEISVSYVGTCKNGLAHGTGEATGEDYYKGEFVKGLPDGKGTYIWKNGATYVGDWKKGLRDGDGTYSSKTDGKDTVLTGRWKSDKYLGSPAVAQYTVDYRNNIGRISFIRVGDKPYVKYEFSRGGVDNLLLQGSSGSESRIDSFTGFEEVTFPFKGIVKFTASNAFMTATINCEIRLTINQPGAWVVTISY